MDKVEEVNRVRQRERYLPIYTLYSHALSLCQSYYILVPGCLHAAAAQGRLQRLVRLHIFFILRQTCKTAAVISQFFCKRRVQTSEWVLLKGYRKKKRCVNPKYLLRLR